MNPNNTPDASTPTGFFVPIAEDECWGLLTTTVVGHVGFLASEGQLVLPVNFAVFDRVIYFQTTVDSVLAELGRGIDDVAFTVTYREDLDQSGWNVMVSGATRKVENASVLQQLAETDRLHPWAPGDRTFAIQLEPRTIGGRRVSQHGTLG